MRQNENSLVRFTSIGDCWRIVLSSRRFRSLLVPIAGITLIVSCVRVFGSFEFPDLNGDGRDDVLLQRGETYLCGISPESNDPPTLTSVDDFPRITAGSHIAAYGDFNGDDTLDLLFRDEEDRWELISMNGCSPVEDSRQSSNSVADFQWRVVGTFDLNGDDRDDLILKDDAGSWSILFMDGLNDIRHLLAPDGLPVDTYWYVIGVGDFNGDDRDDILIKHRDGAWELKTPTNSNAETFLSIQVPFETKLDWRDESIGDYNGDGRPDLLLRHADGSWKVQSINTTTDTETTTLTEWQVSHLPSDWAWNQAATGDLDGDGIDELIGISGTDRWLKTSINPDSNMAFYPIASDPTNFAIPRQPVYIPDLALRNVIYTATELTQEAWIFASQLASLQMIDAMHGERISEEDWIRDLRGLRHVRSLSQLNIPGHRIEILQPLVGLNNIASIDLSRQRFDLDLRPLAESTTLERLNLAVNNKSDFSILANLTNLRWLSLSGNNIDDLSFLSELSELETLILCCAGITDISPLSNLTTLRELTLNQNLFLDLQPLSKLTNLRVLYLDSNRHHAQLSDISPLAELINLENLNLEGNLIQDIVALSNLQKLRTLILNGNQITDITPLGKLSQLRTLQLSDNQVIEITALSTLVNLVVLWLENNQIEELSPLTMLPNLRELRLSINPLSENSQTMIIPTLIANGVDVNFIPTFVFRSSHGRYAQYSYDQENALDTPNGVLVYFHGNISTNSTESYLVSTLNYSKSYAEALDLVFVVIASPYADTSSGQFAVPNQSGDATRSWNYNEDLDLVHELLQSDFDGNLEVDTSRVFLWGSSQGTCFLNQFMRRWGTHYGGGLFAECGCSEGLDPLLVKHDDSTNPMRVLVNAPTNDFLHTLSVQAYGYYKHVLGLETIGDLAREGHHCANGNISTSDALAWLSSGEGLTEYTAQNAEEAYLTRVSLLDRVVGLANDQDGALWVVQQERTGESAIASLWRSVDRGISFESVSRIREAVHDLDVVGNALFVTTSDGDVMRSLDAGVSFEQVEFDSSQASVLIQSDTPDTLGYPHVYQVPTLTSTQSGALLTLQLGDDDGATERILVSTDLGETWERFSVPAGQDSLSPDPVNFAGEQWHLTLSNPVEWIAEDSDLIWSEVDLASEYDGNSGYYPLGSVAWDGHYLVGYSTSQYGPMWRSYDLGRSWEDLAAPDTATPSFGRYGAPKLSAIDHEEVLLIGGGRDAHVFDGDDGSWTQIFGGAAIGLQAEGFIALPTKVAVDPVRGDIYVTDSRGIFRIDARFRERFGESISFSDRDSDGIPDTIDRYPADGTEYLDTDGDGIGNAADDDDDGDGREDMDDAIPLDRFEFVDLDNDGVGNVSDNDIDGDRIPNALDQFPWNRDESVDSDGDGIGNWEDSDDDNDGVSDLEDYFPLYPLEVGDADRDYIGDEIDPHPNDSTLEVSEYLTNAVGIWSRFRARSITFDEEPTSSVIYPTVTNGVKQYTQLSFGDVPQTTIEFMLVSFEGVTTQLLYYDRNGDGDLTNDQSVMRLENGVPTEAWERNWVEVSYDSEMTLPYTLDLKMDVAIVEEDEETQLELYRVGKVSMYEITDGSIVAVAAIDADADGVFNGLDDYVCIDLNQDQTFNDCDRDDESAERFTSGSMVTYGDVTYNLSVSPSGYGVGLQPIESANGARAQPAMTELGKRHTGIEILEAREITRENFTESPMNFREKKFQPKFHSEVQR